nr:MAG TPA: PROTEIN/RNA Complex, archaeal, ribosomal, 30S, protein.0A [Caudoviricetes sp.]
MTTSTYDLSDTINQRYKYNTKGKTPTQINRELREKGVQGFVIKVGSNKVVMKVLEEHKNSNRECMKNGNAKTS